MRLNVLPAVALAVVLATPAMAQKEQHGHAQGVSARSGGAPNAGMGGGRAGPRMGGGRRISGGSVVSSGRVNGGQAVNRSNPGSGQWSGRSGRNFAGRGWRGAPAVGIAIGPSYYGSDYGYSDYAYDDNYSSHGYDPSAEDDSFCAQRFRSYDPASATYLGYDGQRHPCP